MAYTKKVITLELKDFRGRGPQVTCTERPPTHPSCKAKNFIGIRMMMGQETMVLVEHYFDGCPHHVVAVGQKMPVIELVTCLQGRMRHELEGQARVVTAGQVYLKNYFERAEVQLEPKRPFKLQALRFVDSWWEKFLKDEGGMKEAAVKEFRFATEVRTASSGLTAALHLVSQGFHEGVQSGSPLLLDAAALQTALFLMKEHPHTLQRKFEEQLDRRHDPRLQRAIDYLTDQYRHPVGLSEMAGAAAMSRSQLVRLFRKEMGITPYQYVMKYRVEKAAALMQAKPGLSLTQVSEAVGIPNVRHLCRLVLQVTGKKPSQIRFPGRK